MARNTRWTWFCGLFVLVVLLALAPPAEGHHHRKPDYQAPPPGSGQTQGEFSDYDIDSGRALGELNRRALANAQRMNTRPLPRNATNACQGKNVLIRQEWCAQRTAPSLPVDAKG